MDKQPVTLCIQAILFEEMFAFSWSVFHFHRKCNNLQGEYIGFFSMSHEKFKLKKVPF